MNADKELRTTYKKTRKAIRQRLERLQTAEANGFGHDPKTLTWCHVSDLSCISHNLGEIVKIIDHAPRGRRRPNASDADLYVPQTVAVLAEIGIDWTRLIDQPVERLIERAQKISALHDDLHYVVRDFETDRRPLSPAERERLNVALREDFAWLGVEPKLRDPDEPPCGGIG